MTGVKKRDYLIARGLPLRERQFLPLVQHSPQTTCDVYRTNNKLQYLAQRTATDILPASPGATKKTLKKEKKEKKKERKGDGKGEQML